MYLLVFDMQAFIRVPCGSSCFLSPSYGWSDGSCEIDRPFHDCRTNMSLSPAVTQASEICWPSDWTETVFMSLQDAWHSQEQMTCKKLVLWDWKPLCWMSPTVKASKRLCNGWKQKWEVKVKNKTSADGVIIIVPSKLFFTEVSRKQIYTVFLKLNCIHLQRNYVVKCIQLKFINWCFILFFRRNAHLKGTYRLLSMFLLNLLKWPCHGDL